MDIIIGEGIKGCSAISCWNPKDKIENKCGIAENSSCYWISVSYEIHAFSNIRNIIVFKNTNEGENIKRLLDIKIGKILNEYIIKLYFENLEINDILYLLKCQYNKGIENGKKISKKK